MPRGRKRKIKVNIKPQVYKSIAALGSILISLMIIISFIFPEYTVNTKVNLILKSLFGWAAFGIPVIFLLMGLLLIDPIKLKIKDPRVISGVVLLLFMLAALIHLFYLDEGYTIAKDGKGGGIIGFKLAQLLVDTISIYGGIIVLGVGITLALILIFNISLDDLFTTLFKIVEKIKLPKLNFNLNLNKKSVQDQSGTTTMTALPFIPPSPPIHDKKEPIEAVTKPAFEVIPSLSEPQGEQNVAMLDNKHTKQDKKLVSIADRLPYSDKVWEYPPLDLLADPIDAAPDRGDVQARAKVIKDTLKSFGINVEVVDIKYGPSVTQYALEAETGTKLTKILNLQYDIAMALASPTGSVRIEAPIPGKSLIGVEVPNNSRVPVDFKSLLISDTMKAAKSKLNIILGRDVGGAPVISDIGKMPHLLIAGATGSGKSVFIHSILFSILFRAGPNECKFILVDPKRVELIHYQDIPHLLTPVVTDMEKAPSVFKWAVSEMERRYKLFESAKARNIDMYNEKSGFQALPYIVLIVDELAEIMVTDPQGVEKSIVRLGQLARATGIHLVLALQRPSTNIITGVIKANIPSRVAFNVTSQVDSRVIIDQPGAEKLLGKGDMLYVPPDAAKPIRIQGAYITDKEIAQLVNYLKSTEILPDYKEEIMHYNPDKSDKLLNSGGSGSTDALYDEAVDIITSAGKASASLLQRRLSIGYARAARIIDELEANGVIAPAQGSKAREVISGSSLESDEVPQEDEITQKDIWQQ